MKLSALQERAMKKVGNWFKSSDQLFYLTGFAGSGKTTCIKYLADNSDGEVLFGAYTGKAASVMANKGCHNARTIHSLIYHPAEADTTFLIEIKQAMDEAKEAMNEKRIRELEDELDDEQRKLLMPRFSLNEESEVKNASLVILDECSMVNDQMAEDLLSFGTKVLVVGDPAQLPPVRGTGFFTDRKADFHFDEIHRQAQGNPIIAMSMLAREGKQIPFCSNGAAKKIRKNDFSLSMATEIDQVITGMNRTRRMLNSKIRRKLGFSGEYPEKDDKIICLRNEKSLGLLNGVLCFAASDAIAAEDIELDSSFDGVEENGQEIFLDVEKEDKIILKDLSVWNGPFKAYKTKEEPFLPYHERKEMQEFDFGYAITVHKSQGSQWETVLFYDDGMAKKRPAQRNQLIYTAITRAEKEFVLVDNRK